VKVIRNRATMSVPVTERRHRTVNVMSLNSRMKAMVRKFDYRAYISVGDEGKKVTGGGEEVRKR
jgi:hypothetical protein